ncbi:MAG TPA: sigma-70 family RNA polymerase sigma factor [Gemmataceae bacterium]|jgi:RNA polymerase sigma-70 factor (ECF subfamily)
MMGPDVLGRLLDAHAAALALYARQWTAAPEDAVQEAFLKLAARSAPPADPVAWLYAVTRNLARTAGRSERRRRHHEAAAAARSPAWFVPAEGTALDAEAAAAALGGLPAEEREVVVARVWGGLSFEQIGGLIGASAATAHRRFAAGLALLRERLRLPCPTTRSTPTSPP